LLKLWSQLDLPADLARRYFTVVNGGRILGRSFLDRVKPDAPLFDEFAVKISLLRYD
jgi:hypothetical protein